MAKGKSTSTTSTSQQTSSIPKWLERAGEETYKRFSGLADTAATPFSEADKALGRPLVAGLTPDHTAGFREAREAATSYKPYVPTPGAFSTLEAATGQTSTIDPVTGARKVTFDKYTPETIERFMNPYRHNVIRDALSETDRAAEIERDRIGNRFVGGGAFGGARHGIESSELTRNALEKKNQLTNTLFDQAFQQATGQYNRERDALFRQEDFNTQSALNKLRAGEALQGLNLRGAGALQGIGDVQRGVEQDTITAAQGERQRPLDIYRQQGALLSGIPFSRTTTGSQTTPEAVPDRTGQLIGAGANIAGAFLMSDERMKENKHEIDGSGEPALAAFRDMPVSTYEYKPEAQGALGVPDGERVGPMAQDYAKSFGGDGSSIDLGNAVGVLMQAIKELDARTMTMSPANSNHQPVFGAA